MPKKCDSCRHYGTIEQGTPRILVPGLADRSRHTTAELCSNDLLCTDEIRSLFPNRRGLPLDFARNICDREGDGIFVYYEPKAPTAGAAFAGTVDDGPLFASAAAGGAR